MIRFAAWIAVAGMTCGAIAQDKPAEKKADKPEPKAEAKADKPAPAGDSLHPIAKIVTSLGEITLELDAEKAPLTVANFAQYAQDGYYGGTIFHRVMSNFMVQGGGYTPDIEEKKTGLRPGIKNEWQTGLKNVRGTIAMARRGWQPGMPPAAREDAVNSATSQFFINVVDNAMLDQPQADGAAYTAFGKVIDGMDVVEKIRTASVQIHPKYPSGNQPVVPTEPIIIKSVTVTGYDKDKLAGQVAKAEESRKAAAEAARLLREKEVQDFVAKVEKETGKKVEKTASGLMYVILKEGAGESPKATDKVEVHYTGWLLNGEKFDSSVDKGKPLVWPANGFVKGWTEALVTMKVGEKRKLIIPPDLAYGEKGRPGIPSNAYLHFELELLGINPKTP